MGKDIEIKKQMNRQELSAFFRDLANELDDGDVHTGNILPVKFEELSKIKISVKLKQDLINLKIKFKSDGIPELSGEKEKSENKANSSGDYKKLKKKMKKSFNAIGECIKNGVIPPEEIVNIFIDDSRLMIKFSGYGDEYYQQYDSEVTEFSDSFKSGDLEKITKSYQKLRNIKKHCHDAYK